ncbi:MAG: hypothetical protein JO255_05725 [Alphaproteobacteria bacterium]|nr:hypothetical protein [Alphaproteobacteria bacterium]
MGAAFELAGFALAAVFALAAAIGRLLIADGTIDEFGGVFLAMAAPPGSISLHNPDTTHHR